SSPPGAWRTAGCEAARSRARRRGESSISPTPSRASANTAFFCESVGSTWALSPVRWVAVRSPASVVVTDRSVIRCRPPARSTCTSRVSAFPYWLSPSTIAIRRAYPRKPPALSSTCGRDTPVKGVSRPQVSGLLASAVGGVGVRAEQQRDVVALAGRADPEGDHHLRVERVRPQVRPGVEDQPVQAGVGRPPGEPAVGVG